MIAPFLPIIFLMIVVFGQPHDRCRIHSGSAAPTWSSERAPPAPLHRSPKARTACANTPREAATPNQVTRAADPNARERPAAAAVSPRTGRALTGSDRIAIDQVTAAVELANRMSAYPSTAARANDTSPLVVLLMVRPEIKSVSDLTGKEIAIDGRPSVRGDRVLAAIHQAGAARVRLSRGPTRAVNRLLREQVRAAVLAVISAEAAESFPDVAGFKIFRITAVR